eukprot:TRINITY_DN21547_c0_g1_i1.p1 TRINITY_DN21547_c0_g1~~TRINITY_DN21547_c0_g1_i1.p1  ORF type:complete len:348 (-),score=13.49 TRINITY_DN21547_c0_g1_i1:77-1120(-)
MLLSPSSGLPREHALTVKTLDGDVLLNIPYSTEMYVEDIRHQVERAAGRDVMSLWSDETALTNTDSLETCCEPGAILYVIFNDQRDVAGHYKCVLVFKEAGERTYAQHVELRHDWTAVASWEDARRQAGGEFEVTGSGKWEGSYHLGEFTARGRHIDLVFESGQHCSAMLQGGCPGKRKMKLVGLRGMSFVLREVCADSESSPSSSDFAATARDTGMSWFASGSPRSTRTRTNVRDTGTRSCGGEAWPRVGGSTTPDPCLSSRRHVSRSTIHRQGSCPDFCQQKFRFPVNEPHAAHRPSCQDVLPSLNRSPSSPNCDTSGAQISGAADIINAAARGRRAKTLRRKLV